MDIIIEKQLPVKTKIYRGDQVYIPKIFRNHLKWRIGDNVKVYLVKGGLFIEKGD